ncbi:MAG TPA: DUF3221 domain-containing protein [Tissierellia bacterium]|nr:DUF3221 domain-containing protein [Tissierellia bacterium]
MNKKLVLWIGLIIGVIIIVAVLNQVANNDKLVRVSFNATVIENHGTSILVKPEEGSSELNSSDKIVVRVPLNNAQLKDLSEFTEGSKVKITYDGIIMESYPAQINAYDVLLIK